MGSKMAVTRIMGSVCRSWELEERSWGGGCGGGGGGLGGLGRLVREEERGLPGLDCGAGGRT